MRSPRWARRLTRRLAQRLPLQFRVLHQQFLLRVIDLEALSVQADIPTLLGQFAGVLILIGGFRTIGFIYDAGGPHTSPLVVQSLVMNTMQSFLAGTMLIAGLIAVVTWDNIFPDQRDAMVLSPLPVRPRTVLAAKVTAAAALLGVGVVALNFAIGIALPVILRGPLRFPQIFVAFWASIAAAAIVVYGSVLALQGFTALLLPRRIFLRLSAILQLAAFAGFLTMWLFQPAVETTAALAAPQNQSMLHAWPAFWFLAMFQQIAGSLPPGAAWIAHRAWLALAAVLFGASASLLLCYVRTMKKVAEQPDLLPGSGGWHWTPRLGSRLTSAIVLFSARSLARSRQHRVIYAFFLSIAFAIAVSTVRDALAGATHRVLTTNFLMPTEVMLCLAIVGLRSIFSLPVSLRANWILQITQLRPSQQYIAATRWAVILLSALPIWLVVAGLSLVYRPWPQVAGNLLVFALVSSLLVDLAMLGVSKIPFACSYLPGKSNIQYMFWAFAIGYTVIAMEFSNFEQRALSHRTQFEEMIAVLVLLAGSLWTVNRYRARSAVLYFEEQEPEVLTSLGLSGIVRMDHDSAPHGGTSAV